MFDAELALGQREIVDGFVPTDAELQLLVDNEVTLKEIQDFVKTSGAQTLNAAIGGVKTIKAGQGQVRNEPFTPNVEGQE